MNLKIKLSVFFALIVGLVYGQIKNYGFQRKIENVDKGWYRIQLPDDIFSKVSPNFSDIRIYGINSKNDTIETPYLLRTSNAKTVSKDIAFQAINTTHNGKGYFITFEVPTSEAVNQIDLDFQQSNFDWNIQLEGSQNQTDWFTVLKDYRLIGFKDNTTDFQFTKLNFPTSKFRYFRLFIPTQKDPKFLRAHLLLNEMEKGSFTEHKMDEFKVNTRNKQTEINISLKQPVPISLLKLNIENQVDYYRPINIEYVSDSIKTEKGYQYIFGTIGSDVVNSLKKNQFEFPSVIAQKFRVTIYNQDNAPLVVNSAEASGIRYELVARFTETASYFLVYHNTKASAAEYDLGYFKDKIPDVLASLNLGEEEAIANPKKEEKTKPLFENQLWMWAIMVIIIIILGVFTFKMMKKTSE